MGSNSIIHPVKTQPILTSPLPWVIIISFGLVTVALTLGGAASLMNYMFPAGSLLIGLFLYSKYPIIYNSFCWWIWLLSPFVRRLVDYNSGFSDPSPLLLAPYLVSLVILPDLFIQIPRSNSRGHIPFVLAFVAVLYGVSVGLQFKATNTVLIDTLRWIAPILMGFFTYRHWRMYPDMKHNIQSIFIWGTLILGAYAIYQYLTLPAWDEYWLINAEINSIGDPIPQGFRPWSMLNSGEPFAAFMTAGLLLLLGTQVSAPMLLSTSGVGYLSFLLAMVRSAWLGWIAGLLILWTSLRPRFQIRLIAMIVILAMLIIPLVLYGPYADVITSRLDSFSNLSNDRSAEVRQETFNQLIGTALSSFVGTGIGNQKLDSSIFTFLFDLGWIGTTVYMGGLLLGMLVAFTNHLREEEPFPSILKAIIISVIVRIPVNTVMIEISGMILWVCIALSMAARKYHSYQQLTAQESQISPV